MALSPLLLRSVVVLGALGALAGGLPARAQPVADVRPARQVTDSVEIAALARSLTVRADSDSARAAVLYGWVANNLAYDVRGYLSGRLEDAGAEEVYRRRLAVCGGYVALYQRMAREVGLEVQHIQGYAKGFDYRPGQSSRKLNHAWLAVNVGGRWRLLDPTWGSGVVAGGRFEPRFSWDWFFVDPEALLLSHFPEQDGWQLVSRPLRRNEFERMPQVPTSLVRAGFSPGAIRTAVLRARVRDFPLIGMQPGARVVHAPLSGTLERASTVSVEIVWPGATDVSLVSGGVWTRLARDGDRFRGAVPAAAESVSLVGRPAATNELATVLHYRVE
jgi:hypothetical protein